MWVLALCTYMCCYSWLWASECDILSQKYLVSKKVSVSVSDEISGLVTQWWACMRAIVHGCAPICVLLFMVVRLYAGRNMGFHRSQLTSVTCKLATETYQSDSLCDLQISGKSLTNKKL